MKNLSQALANRRWTVRPISISRVAQDHSLGRPISLTALIIKYLELDHFHLYGKLRSSILSRHFALSRRFRTNMISDDTVLYIEDRSPVGRWKIKDIMDDNPLLISGLLFTSLAVEAHLGSSYSIKVLKKALTALSDLYKFNGNNFDGYILRWDPVLRHDWLDEIKYTDSQSGQVIDKNDPYSMSFFIDPSTQDYIYSAPPNDPRYMQITDTGKYYAWRSHFRHHEPSTDEIAGLIAGYSVIYNLVKDPTIQSLVRDQTNKLADYLNAHGYILVRPNGGFTLRGAAGILPILEYPFNRVFTRITGKSFSGYNVSFEDAMQKAKMWKCLEGPTNWGAVAGVAIDVVSAVLLPGLRNIGIKLSNLLTGVTLSSTQLGRAAMIAQTPTCIDTDTDSKTEFALAYLIKQIPTNLRVSNWLKWAYLGKGTAWATGFIPFIAMTALDDTDPLVRNGYLEWMKNRRAYNALFNNDKDPVMVDLQNWGEKSCFASALALLLGGGTEEEEKILVSRLERSYNEFHNTCGDDLPIFIKIEKDPMTGVIKEKQFFERANTIPLHREPYQPSALDYMAGLSLAWLYAKRRATSGNPVRTPGFPSVPSNIEMLPRAVVPKEVWAYYQKGDEPVDFRKNDIQNTPEVDTDIDIDLFSDSAPEKSKVPLPILVPMPDLSQKPSIDFRVIVSEDRTDVFTGVYLRDGDVYEFSEISGSIWAGVIGTGNNGPNGWDGIEYDTKFPLHGGMDPVNAHPYCLLAKLNNYFFIGANGIGKQRFLYPMHNGFLELVDTIQGVPLHIRINDDAPGNGNGSFSCRLKVWRSSIILPSLKPSIPVACQPIAKHISSLEIQLKQLQERLSKAPTSEKPEIIDQIEAKKVEIADAERQLRDCLAHNNENITPNSGSLLQIIKNNGWTNKPISIGQVAQGYDKERPISLLYIYYILDKSILI